MGFVEAQVHAHAEGRAAGQDLAHGVFVRVAVRSQARAGQASVAIGGENALVERVEQAQSSASMIRCLTARQAGGACGTVPAGSGVPGGGNKGATDAEAREAGSGSSTLHMGHGENPLDGAPVPALA